ncbi:1-acyl-sn-glycerol-3-phosphate acyltransferase [Novosphingobium sp. PC22D]|uniref:lysophospholipid acyltransferase family protein n=1 Tax=Novosphingobium sp. PC22D TaxID=1962403 RepID=UPI000BFAC33E|nr:lysophospholipid acyltransferase family protein [Novosphingobium sp. PC22D]PEQ12804.1 1-acyl-sn-glycerol-3-phosphate acyltransferase [Novosphingobium sp. PC22D]
MSGGPIARLTGAVLVGATRLLVGGHARWQGCAPEPRQRIYFANHASHLDTVILWSALPPSLRRTTHPVAARDYWDRDPLRRHVARDVLGAVLVERRARRDPLGPCRAALAAGGSLILFPEGTRCGGAEPGAFKGGLHHLAREFPVVELVPVHLDNLSRAFPKGAILPAPIVCSATFGAPLGFDPAEPKHAFLERARSAVCALGRRIAT